jgi:hypothetical protein
MGYDNNTRGTTEANPRALFVRGLAHAKLEDAMDLTSVLMLLFLLSVVKWLDS